jgi:predicted transcriptional regulator
MLYYRDHSDALKGELVVDKSLAKALKRKMGLDEEILTRSRVISGDVSLLMNAPRRRIFEYVCNHPYYHLRGISRKLNISLQTAKWHLSKLTEGDLIATITKGKKKLYFPKNGVIIEMECEILFLLRREETLKVYRFIRKHPKETQRTISRSLDIYQQKLSMILLSLERTGMISYEKIGREKAYRSTDKIKEVEESFQKKSLRYEKWLIDVLTRDGVNPHIIESDIETVTIQLEIGREETPLLNISKNPLTVLLRTGA